MKVPQEVPETLVKGCQTVQNQLTSAYQVVINQANVESVGASTQTMESINAYRDSADQLYHDGVKSLNDSFKTAKELLNDESS